MAFKSVQYFDFLQFVVLAAFVAVAHAGYIAQPALSYAAAPLAYTTKVATPIAYAPVAKTVVAEPSAPAHYDYGYTVSDPHTGDQKSQHESRRGDVVEGSYSLVDSDGTKRTVDYTADPHHGFNAVVRKEGTPVAPVVAKVVAPVVTKVTSPVTYAAAPAAYAAPAYSYASPAAVTYAAPAPFVAKYAAAPAYTYAAPSPVVTKYLSAPASISYAAPVPVVAKYAAAPAYTFAASSYHH
ncbi:hypothetical protein HUJ04_005261 [Dendroctonus ponderosae]|nr:hypothetical protein HUJ04_005261 [Dendroctonus ponderosae]